MKKEQEMSDNDKERGPTAEDIDKLMLIKQGKMSKEEKIDAIKKHWREWKNSEKADKLVEWSVEQGFGEEAISWAIAEVEAEEIDKELRA